MATHPASTAKKEIERVRHEFPKEKPDKVLGSKKGGEAEEMEAQQPLFVEAPVCFDFGDDYGNNKLFLEVKMEMAEQARQGILVKETNHADHFVYVFSSQTDIINSFHNEAL